MPHTFTAIDFETAHGKRWSICQVGLVRVVNGEVVDKINRLVRPPDNFYFYRNTEIHGISARDTMNAPLFSAVWNDIKHYIHNQKVVAHNTAFDIGCLHETLDYYNIVKPDFEKACTYKIYGKNLATLCRQYEISLNHHDALSDAMACANLYLLYLDKLKELTY